MALPPGFTRDGAFVNFNPGITQQELERYMTRPWQEFAAKADAIEKDFLARIAALEQRVTELENHLYANKSRKPHATKKTPATTHRSRSHSRGVAVTRAAGSGNAQRSGAEPKAE